MISAPMLTAHSHSLLTASFLMSKSKSKSHLRLMVSQSVSLGVEPHPGLMTRYLLLFDSYGLVSVGRFLWWEDRSVFCICCWPLPAQSFSGQSPLGLATIFYCIQFETSLFVASYDSQGHSEGIQPRLHTGYSPLCVFFNVEISPLIVELRGLVWEHLVQGFCFPC
jgi:hypothetical protein